MLYDICYNYIYNFSDYVGKEFRAPEIILNIYSYYRPEFLEGHFFCANYNVTEQQVLDDLDTVKFE